MANVLTTQNIVLNSVQTVKFLPSPSRWEGQRTLKVMASTSPSGPAEPTPAEDVKTVNVRIKGRVQGVFYRNWTVETAKKLGLDGWVRNRRDGSVEAVFAGKASVVDLMVENCRSGPPAAMVTSLNVQPVSIEVPSGFERRKSE
ncbi:hypothetical protein KP509_28G049800 [Ceratopteris richardii]|uniref:acylphosphatase n=1 Tax=Ceratopteris richardii TaxID=49495 RepID=A0A8T2REI3_CERRI|nr:hypothetical protein KP509_28G049800 [Ceratopteris richardii]